MDKPMEHLKQWFNLYQGTLTANEGYLYIYLFMVANCRYWPEWVELTDSQLALGTNINIKRIPDIINSLSQKKLIISDRGKGKAPSKYQILSPVYYTQMGVINGKKTGDKTEINRRYNGDKREINRRLDEKSPCESKAGEASNTQQKTTQHNDKDIKKEIQKKKSVDVFAGESERVQEALRAFVEMRTKMRKPMTDRAKELLLSKLEELSGGDEFMKIHLLEQSIEHGWQTVYPLKQNFSTRNPQNNPQDDIAKAIAFFESQEEGTA